MTLILMLEIFVTPAISDIANASSLFKINDQGPLANFKVNS